MTKATANTLYFGDNLDILREYVKDESVDLIYLDPPFNSQAQYNVLFERPNEAKASAQAGAFRDTWAWGDEAEWAYREVMKIGTASARYLDALRSALGDNNMMAYIAMMAIRLHELHSKLKETGSLYLHCDPTASHYLKVILDGIFSADQFRNEIIWRRSNAHNKLSRQYGPIHDTILFYTRSDKATFHPGHTPFSRGYVQSEFRFTDDGGRFRVNEVMGPGKRSGASGKPWKGYDPTNSGRHWAIPGSLTPYLPDGAEDAPPQEQLDALFAKGMIILSKNGRPKYKQYLGKGIQYQDIWAFQPGTDGIMHDAPGGIDQDVKWLDSERERIGYPTQKPVGLLERIIETSTNPGEVVLDPFCGCGTTVEASETLGRRWVGIDVAVHAIKVIESRLDDLAERTGNPADYKIEGMPRDFESAEKLAERDKYQFQWWANYLFNPHALREQKKGADRGIDGELFFPNGPGRPWGRMLTSVKGGSVTPAMVRDFGYVLQREKAEMGLFICLRHPTRAMSSEAAGAGISDTVHGDLPRLQIVAIEDWFESKMPLLPPLEHLPSAAISRTSHRRAVKKSHPDSKQGELLLPQIGGKADKDIVRHFNPAMVARSAPSTGLFDTPKQKRARAL